MVIGSYIRGLTVEGGKEEGGIVLDKIRTIFYLQQQVPGQIGKTTMPVPLDAYLVLDTDNQVTHVISPMHIVSIQFPEPETVSIDEP